jgi:hypothetical protein
MPVSDEIGLWWKPPAKAHATRVVLPMVASKTHDIVPATGLAPLFRHA